MKASKVGDARYDIFYGEGTEAPVGFVRLTFRATSQRRIYVDINAEDFGTFAKDVASAAKTVREGIRHK